MEAKGSMPHSQGLSNNPYPEPNQPNSTQPREDNWIATWEVEDPIKKVDIIRLDGA